MSDHNFGNFVSPLGSSRSSDDPTTLPLPACSSVEMRSGGGTFLQRGEVKKGPYSLSDDELLYELESDRVRLKDMAVRLNRSVQSVRARRRTLNIRRKRGRYSRLFTRSMDEIIIAMVECGAPRKDIAKIISRSVSQVNSRILILMVDEGDGYHRRSESSPQNITENAPPVRSVAVDRSDVGHSRFDVRNYEKQRPFKRL